MHSSVNVTNPSEVGLECKQLVITRAFHMASPKVHYAEKQQ